MNELIRDLKTQLDEIDKEVYNQVYDGYLESRLRVLIGMWDKGKIISEFTGGKIRNYKELERQTERSDKSLKQWYEIYKKYLNKEDYIEKEAKQKAIVWTQKALEYKKVIEKDEILPLPEGKFDVIYIDPPWPIGSIVMDKWESPIIDKYKSLDIEDIKNLPVKDSAADNCSLFIWTTHRFLPNTFDIIKEWDFKYHCLITWNKHSGWTHFGFHKMTEFLLYAYKGNINIDQYGKAIPTLIDESKTYHSKKPDSIRNLIKSKTPEKRLEMFARDKYDGWIPWGNEIRIKEDE